MQIASWHEGATPTVALHHAGTGDVPGDLITVLTNASRGVGIRTFKAQPEVTIESNATYTLVLSGDGSDADSAIEYSVTAEDGYDHEGADGWSLDEGSLLFSSDSWEARDAAIRVTVLGMEQFELTWLEGHCSKLNPSASDPLYGCQWHLNNSGQYPGGAMQDINVEVVWAGGNLGQGINVAIVDDGLDYKHIDLRENVLTERNHSHSGGSVRVLNRPHGTKVAGILAARDNSIGGRGVAPRANMYVYELPTTPDQRADVMSWHASDTAVSNNSWGFPNIQTLHKVSDRWEWAIEDGVKNGYGGRGVLYVFAAGNGTRAGDYSNLSELTSHYGVTAVCAVDHNDVRSVYSEMGPNLWLCAPSNDTYDDSPLPKIATTTPRNRYTKGFGGTSAAAPIVSGTAALVRAANPELTWRDVKLILAASARKNDATDTGWQEGALKYGSTSDRYSHNHQYGFGVVDAGSAVAVAESWTNLPPLRTISARSGRSLEIPSPNDRSHIVPEVRSRVFLNGHVDFIEYIAVEVTMTHPYFRDLRMELESPNGAVSVLTVSTDYSNPFGYFGRDPRIISLQNDDFRLGSAVHLGENAYGMWTLRIKDEFEGSEGVLRSWKLTAYGHGHSPDAPSITDTTTGSETITVAWAPPGENGGSDIVSYDVRYIRSDSKLKEDPANWTVDAGVWTSGEMSHLLTGLVDGHRYDIQVRAVNGQGPGSWSETATESTAAEGPGTPTQYYAVPRDGAVDVRWRRPAHNGGAAITHYDLRYYSAGASDTDDTSKWTVHSGVAPAGNPTTARIEGLRNGSDYWIQVRAVNGAGPGAWTLSFRGAPRDPTQ